MLNKLGKIVAIGGGEIGRPGFPIETEKIDREIIRLSGKKSPKLLFIPTASSDSSSYYEVVKNYFGNRLSCRVSVLNLIKTKDSRRLIKEKILNSDIIYVGGGDTLMMMKIWRGKGIDKILKQALNKGIILSGLSAGAICWFKYGHSDSRKFRNAEADFIRVSGLGFIDALLCPHYLFEKKRKGSLKEIMRRTKGYAIALDNGCALEVVGSSYRLISSLAGAKAYRTYWRNGKYVEEDLTRHRGLRPLSSLLLKE